jgi:hypothetical protein
MNQPTNNFRFAIFFTKKLEYLISCIETGSYGESIAAFRAKQYDNLGDLRNIQAGDRVFLRFETKILAGPFIVTTPHEHFVIDDSASCWHKVNVERTPKEYHPIWIYDKPWCFFFDLSLASQVNYRLFAELPIHLSNLPPTKFIPRDVGQQLWEYLEEFGYPFADFIQRQATRFRYRQRLDQQYYTNQQILCTAQAPNPTITFRHKTKIGAFVRSKSELIIADSLFDNGYRFQYEKTMFLDDNVIHPDFYLPDCELIIEHLGLYESSPKYREDWAWREDLYKKHNLKYLVLRESDINDINKNLLTKLWQNGCRPTFNKT